MSRELPPLNALRAFEATARLQSVSRAAQELHVTHGAVSRQIRLLEESLGRALFERQGRGLGLTSSGRQLQERVAVAFDQLRESWAELKRKHHDGAFVLGCSSSLLARWLIPRLDRLEHELPSLKLHLSAEENPLEPTRAELDAALVLAAPPWPSAWHVHRLAPEFIGPVVSPRYAAIAGLLDQPEKALSNESLLHTSSRPQAWPDWASAAGLPPESMRGGQGFTHLYYLLEAAIAGLGVAIAPAPLVREDLAAGRLIAPWGFRETSASWILATPARSEDRRAEALIAWLRSELAAT